MMNLKAKKKLGQDLILREYPLIGFCANAVWLVLSEVCVLLWANIYQPIHENQTRNELINSIYPGNKKTFD